MGTPFMGEIRICAFYFAPRGWALCSGDLKPINQNQALFSLLGTTYGGDGRTNFALPNLQGRVPIHMGNGFTQGEQGGQENHTLTFNEIPTHTHTFTASSETANIRNSKDAYLAVRGDNSYSNPANSLVAMNPAMKTTNTGGNQPHSNMQPYLVLNFVIALQGIFPSQN